MNRDDLETLVRLHQQHLYRYLRYLGASPQTAEDLVQDTFLAAYASGQAPPAEAEPRCLAWLRGIARNLFLKHCRRQRTHERALDESRLAQAEAFWTGEFLRDGDGYDYVAALRECLGELPADQRQAIELRYTQGQSRDAMAGQLALTADGVKALLRRIRARLGECIRRRLAAEGS